MANFADMQPYPVVHAFQCQILYNLVFVNDQLETIAPLSVTKNTLSYVKERRVLYITISVLTSYHFILHLVTTHPIAAKSWQIWYCLKTNKHAF